MDDELVVRAAIRDELSRPLESIRRELAETARTADRAGRTAGNSSRGWDRLSSGVSRVARTAGRMGGYALAGLATATAAVGTAAVVTGVKTAAGMQTARIAFETMLGSARKADAFIRDLAKFAAKTPFEFPELQTAASALISAGIEADKVIPIMTTLGDVTSGMGTGSEGIQRATVALQQMNAAQRITGEDLNQLRDAGIPVYDLLAKATGKSKAEVVKLAQAGKLGKAELDQMMKALETGEGLERFNGLMEKQSASLTGVWSTLKDTLGMGLATALQPAIPVLTELTLKASDLAESGMGPLRDGIEWAVDAGQKLAKGWDTGGLEGLSDAVADVFGPDTRAVFDAAVEAGTDLATIFTDVLAPAFTDVAGLVPLAPLALLTEGLGFVADNAETFSNILEAGIIIYGTATAAITAYRIATALAEAWTKRAAITTGILNTVMALNPIGLVVAALVALGVGLYVAYQKSETFRGIVDATWSVLKTVGSWIATVFVGHLRVMAAFWLTVAQIIVKAVRLFVEPVLAGFGHIVEGAAKAFGWVPGLGGKIKGAAESFNGFADTALGALDSADRKIGDTRNRLIGLGEIEATPTIRVRTPGVASAIAGVQAAINNVKGKTVTVGVISAQLGASGDTATSRARGRGNIASTLAAHHTIADQVGARATITNAFVGGGGRGYGSGDHQAGRALDLQGSGLNSYARAMREAGGFAEWHGTGSDRHLHAVPPASGDTATTRVRTPQREAASDTGTQVIFQAGAIVIQGSDLSPEELEAAVANAIEAWLREREERA